MLKASAGLGFRFGGPLAAASAVVPAPALACAACAQRAGSTGLSTIVVLASMVLLPFLVAAVVVRIIRRIDSES
jgi:hypothetical protein